MVATTTVETEGVDMVGTTIVEADLTTVDDRRAMIVVTVDDLQALTVADPQVPTPGRQEDQDRVLLAINLFNVIDRVYNLQLK